MAQDQQHQQDTQLRFRNIRLLRREELGHGSFGFVCKAQCDQLICAAKVIYRVLRQAVAPDPGREYRQPHRRFQSEIDFLKHMHHPNIVQYLGTYEDPDSGDLVLLMELMDESLTHFLESSPGDIPYHTQVNLSYDIAQALAFLHSNGIIHRDLSSNNVLLAGTRAKVTDFGMSKFTERNISMTLSPGTPVFMPPEALKDQPAYTEKLDNFSFGALLVQIITKKFPEPTERVKTQEVMNIATNQIILAEVPIPEVERRHGHISIIEQDHPLLPIALDCLKDRDQERPSSQELCARLNTLKRSDRYHESSQQDPASALREQLQTQNQQYQAEIREKNEQLQAENLQHQAEIREKNEQLQAENLQHQAEIQEKNEQLQAENQQHRAEIELKNEQILLIQEQLEVEIQEKEQRIWEKQQLEAQIQQLQREKIEPNRKCPVCHTQFPQRMRQQDFNNHVQGHLKEKQNEEHTPAAATISPRAEQPNRTCPMCRTKFPTRMRQQDFDNHVQSHFETEPSKESTTTSTQIEQRSRTCPVCSTKFPIKMRQEHFEAHVQGHFKCE